MTGRAATGASDAATGLQSDPDQPVRRLLAGIDVGGTNTKVLVTTTDLVVLDRIDVPTPAHRGGAVIVATALAALDVLLDRIGAGDGGVLVGVGVGAAGVVDAVTGEVLVTADSFTGWAGFAVTAAIEAALGVPATLDNDVNAFLRGEASTGAVAGEQDVLGMTLGTGVGGALLLGGALFGGPHGAAGEIGHVPGFGDARCTCGQTGHLETLASARGIVNRHAERTGRTIPAHEVAAVAEAGDPDALAVFTAAGRGLARAILVTAGILDVTTVVIGGGVSRAWGVLEPIIRAGIDAEPPVSGATIRVAQALLGADAVALGAASRALELVGR